MAVVTLETGKEYESENYHLFIFDNKCDLYRLTVDR